MTHGGILGSESDVLFVILLWIAPKLFLKVFQKFIQKTTHLGFRSPIGKLKSFPCSSKVYQVSHLFAIKVRMSKIWKQILSLHRLTGKLLQKLKIIKIQSDRWVFHCTIWSKSNLFSRHHWQNTLHGNFSQWSIFASFVITVMKTVEVMSKISQRKFVRTLAMIRSFKFSWSLIKWKFLQVFFEFACF